MESMLNSSATRVEMAPSSLPLELQCPECARPLPETPQGFACRACGAAWPTEAGVWRFGENNGYPLDFSPTQTAELLAIAEHQGWQVALHDQMRRWDSARYRRAVDEYRAQWRCLIPSNRAGRALDFRCGWGTTAVALAEDYQVVVAADTHYHLARFTALRCAATGRANVQPLSVDPRKRLPFQSGYFDAIALHGVLEWCSNQTIQPVELLREAARVLNSDGYLFLMVGNRLNPMQLLQLSRKTTNEGADNRGSARPSLEPKYQSRTLKGYQRLLAGAGFKTETIYGILPAIEEPFYIVPADRQGPIRFFLDSLFGSQSLHLALSKRHLLAPFKAARAAWNVSRFLPLEGLMTHLMPGYAILASK
jgi:SAM-dependent methyltransferase